MGEYAERENTHIAVVRGSGILGHIGEKNHIFTALDSISSNKRPQKA
jgi:hypothetical protein